jgi:hypothetical protein
MIGKSLFLLLAILALTAPFFGQDGSKLADCRKIVVQDSERRGFKELESFTLDVDGDGRPDTITPRTYTVRTNRKIFNGDEWKPLELHWITFDIKTAKGRALKSFFKYRYGNNVDDYYVFAFVPCTLNRDGKPDLLFYAGDDVDHEMVILVNRNNVFKVHSRKVEEFWKQ